MKNVTIALDDDTHRKARIRAAELGTSLSALVKTYLEGLAGDGGSSNAGVRDMQMTFKAQPAAPLAFGQDALPPGAYGRSADGTPYYTKDGKPRKPGAMRDTLWVAEDFDEWPDGFIDAMYGEETAAAKNWWKPYADPPQGRKAK